MFTGIITDLGRIKSIEQHGDRRIAIETSFDVDSIDIGASIACSGICLTVVDKGESWFAVDISAETTGVTTAGKWTEGDRINLERALRVGDELGGHILTGHVDGVGRIEDIADEGDSKRFTFAAPKALMAYIAPKGSIAVDGVSLTVNEVGEDRFGVNIIPHTQQMTRFAAARPGEPVNLEIDILARYVARLEQTQ